MPDGGHRFRDRRQAGRLLADTLVAADCLDLYAGPVVVLALPRGGVPVGDEMARRLGAPLDVLLVRKLGVPGREELAMGAITGDGQTVLNPTVIEALGVSDAEVEVVARREALVLARREETYRDGRPPLSVAGATVVLVDDGLATGATMRAAMATLRPQGPVAIIVAIPVAPAQTCAELRAEADEVLCTSSPEPFVAVGQAYKDFRPTTDETVVSILEGAFCGVR